MPEELTIEDLQQHSGLSIRTLRYYMQEGLLPGPDKRGKFAAYSQEHLDRLDLILILKELHLPLDEIRTILESLTPEEVREYRHYQGDLLGKIKALQPESKTTAADEEDTSALAYIRRLEEAHGMISEIKNDPVYRNESPEFYSNLVKHVELKNRKQADERWRRVIFADGIELHTRETRDKAVLNKIDRLRSFAQSLFGNKKEDRS